MTERGVFAFPGVLLFGTEVLVCIIRSAASPVHRGIVVVHERLCGEVIGFGDHVESNEGDVLIPALLQTPALLVRTSRATWFLRC